MGQGLLEVKDVVVVEAELAVVVVVVEVVVDSREND